MKKNTKKEEQKASVDKIVVNCLPCIYTVYQGNPYKIGLFHE